MAGRGRSSSQKRHKEQVRLERRQEKAARKQARQTNKEEDPTETMEPLDGPLPLDFFEDLPVEQTK
jgi:hypothetical protein